MPASDTGHPTQSHHRAPSTGMPASPDLVGQLWEGIGPSSTPFSDRDLAWALMEATACDAAFIVDTHDANVLGACPSEATIPIEAVREILSRCALEDPGRVGEGPSNALNVVQSSIDGRVQEIGCALASPVDVGEGGVRCAVLFWHKQPTGATTAELRERMAFVVQMLGVHRKKLRELGWRRRVPELIRKALASLERARAKEEVYGSVLLAIGDTFGEIPSAVYLLDPEKNVYTSAFCYPPTIRDSFGPQVLAGNDWPLSGMSESTTLVAPPDAGDARWPAPLNLHPWWVARIRSSRATLGCIMMMASDPQDVDGDIRVSLDIAGYLLGVALDRLQTHMQMHADLAIRNRQWQALYSIATRLTHLLGSDGLLNEILKEAVELLDCNQGAVFVRSGDSDKLVLRTAYGRRNDISSFVGLEIPLDSPAIGRAIEEQRAVAVHGRFSLPTEIDTGAASEIEALIAAPLVVGQSSFGALLLTCDNQNRRFNELDTQTLGLLCQQASAVIEKERSQQHLAQLELRAERERLAMTLHDGLSQTLAAVMIRADLCQEMGARDNPALEHQLELISQGLQRAIGEAQAAISALEVSDT